MRIAIISDIHGNLEALNVVLEYCEKAEVDELISLGDVVGYGPNPNECVNLIEKNASIKIMGNHDHAVLGLTDIQKFNLSAQVAVDWTLMQLDDLTLDYISQYRMMHEANDLIFVHSSPSNPFLWNYVIDGHDAQYEMSFSMRVKHVLSDIRIFQLYSVMEVL